MSFLAVTDRDPERARALDEAAGAQVHSSNNDEIISHPDVTAVFVSTPEGEHAAPVRKALELGKPVLIEKPLAMSLEDADRMLATLKATGGDLRVGYSRRFKECYLRAKEQMVARRAACQRRDPLPGRHLEADLITVVVDARAHECPFVDNLEKCSNLADKPHGLDDPLGIRLEERLERGLILIGNVLVQIAHRLRERLAFDGLAGSQCAVFGGHSAAHSSQRTRQGEASWAKYARSSCGVSGRRC